MPRVRILRRTRLLLSGWIASTLLAAQPELVVIHWNDFHSNNLPYQIGRPEPGYLVGGYAYLAGYVDSLRQVYPQALLLDAGDEFQGSPISNLTRGLSQILILNRLKIHAFVPGNHEFDYGFDNLRTVLGQAQFPIITTNYYDSTKMELLSRPYIVYRTGGYKVAILGIGWSDLKSSMLASNARGLGILDPVNSIKQWVARLQQSVDIIVVLSHSGFEEDSLLATQLEEVDVIVGGHSHTILRQPRVVNNILICQAGSNGRYVGCLRGKVDLEHNRLLDYQYELIETRQERIRPYLPVALLVDSLENSIKSTMDEVIGELITDWRRNSDGESNIGDWLCDVTREYFKVDIALMNSGGIRKNLKAGPIRVRDIWEIMPFDNTVVKFKVTGKQLWQMLQYRLENPRDFLQVSGLKYTYDGRKQKLLTVEVGGQPLQEQATYWIATNNFVMSQFERFFGLNSTQVEMLATEVVLRDILLQAVRQQQVIDSRVNGRIVEINQP